jgi:hypothetical protein
MAWRSPCSSWKWRRDSRHSQWGIIDENAFFLHPKAAGLGGGDLSAGLSKSMDSKFISTHAFDAEAVAMLNDPRRQEV